MTFTSVAVSSVRLAQPWWLLAVLVGAAPIVVAVWARRRGTRVAARGVVLQVLAVAAGAAALARPSVIVRGEVERPWMLLEDVSASTRQQQPLATGWAAGVPLEVYDFAQSVARRGGDAGDHATHLAPALKLADARAGQLSGLLIHTDGRFQDTPDGIRAAEALARSGMKVLIVPMETPPADARIVELAAARRRDGKVRLRVTVAANAMRTRELTVLRKGPPREVLLSRKLRLLAGDPVTIRLTDAGGDGDGLAVYGAALSDGDAFPENDTAEAMVLPARQRVALVAAPGGMDRAALAAALKLPLVAVSPADGPREPAGWMNYAAVILQDPTGELLDVAGRSALADAVRAGGGLVLVGAGPHGAPPDRNDPLNQVAALVPDPFERRPLKVIVVLDASGSMAEPAAETAPARRIKFDLAAEAVMGLARHLTPKDALTVITFANADRLIYDSGDRPPEFARLHDALRAVEPTGPTRVGPALARAIAAAPRGKRDGLVLLLSDLRTQDRKFDAPAVAAQFRQRKLRLAVVVSGAAPARKTPLEALAAELDAPIVYRKTLKGLARVFAQQVRKARGEAVRQGRFTPKFRPGVFGLSEATLSTIDTYLLCGLAPGAERLGAIGSDPILARRRVGLGRSAALAVPVSSRDNAALRNSPALAALVSAAARWSARPAGDPRFSGAARRRGNLLRVEVDARDARGPMNRLALTARLSSDAAADVASARLVQDAPGHYRAEIHAPRGPAVLIVRDEASGRAVWQLPIPRTAGQEFAAIGADRSALRRLAEATGGTIVAPDSLPALTAELAEQRYTDLWAWLVGIALALMLVDWCVTRVRRGP